MSFEAYSVAVRLKLIDDVGGSLLLMSGQLQKTGREVDVLQSKLTALHKLAIGGAGATAAGLMGLGIIGKALKPAEEYTSQLVKMNMAGMNQVEIAEAVGAAWKLTAQNMTTTATGNLKALLDLRNVTGDWKEAKEFLPIMARMQTVLAASKDGKLSQHADDLAFSAMKALDIRGAVNDPERLKAQADLMTRVIIGTQGRVTPEQYQSIFSFARQAKFSLSDDFAYKYLPTLMLENATKGGGGGGSKGVGPMLAALYRFSNQGFVNRKSLPLLAELGWLGNGSVLRTSTPGTVVAPLKDSQQAAANSFLWAQERFKGIDAYLAKHHIANTDANVLQIINQATRGNQLAGSLLGEYYIKKKNFERDRHLMEGVMSPEDAYKAAMTKDPATARRALQASWENFETSMMMNVVPIIVPALNSLSKELNNIGDFARHHPNMTKDLVIGFGALSGVLAVGGSLITGIAITRLAFGGLSSKVAAVGEAAEGAVSTVAKFGRGLGALTAAAAPLMAMLAVKEWAEDQTHDRERVDTLQSWSSGLKSILPSFMGDPTKGATGRYMAARGELDGTGGDYVRAGGRSSIGTIQNIITLPDKRVLAEVVTEVLAKELNRPPVSANRFDGRMNLAPVSGR